jgi:hypothetical protein
VVEEPREQVMLGHGIQERARRMAAPDPYDGFRRGPGPYLPLREAVS